MHNTVAVLASIPSQRAGDLVRKHAWKTINRKKFSGPLGEDMCKFFNVVVYNICWVLAKARIEKDGPRGRDRVSWTKELFGDDNISELPFDVNDIAVQLKALFESKSTMEPSEYEAKLAALQSKLIEKLVKDMLAGPYFKEVFDRLVETAW